MTTRPQALRLADEIDPLIRYSLDNLTCSAAATELRRLHNEILVYHDDRLKLSNEVDQLKAALAAPVQEPVNWSVYNSGAEVASGLTFSEAWDYLTPERLARQWCAVCVVDQSNMPATLSPAVEELCDDAIDAIEQALATPVQEPMALEEYDAGVLNDYGGGNVEWWQDYIRAELGRAYEHYQSQMATPPATPVQEPDWSHPKIQALIGADARNRITIDLIWRILENPNGEYTASDMEYWDAIHDAVQAAAQRQWVGLTDEELDQAWQSLDYTVSWAQHRIDIARAIEAKLREKNQ